MANREKGKKKEVLPVEKLHPTQKSNTGAIRITRSIRKKNQSSSKLPTLTQTKNNNTYNTREFFFLQQNPPNTHKSLIPHYLTSPNRPKSNTQSFKKDQLQTTIIYPKHR